MDFTYSGKAYIRKGFHYPTLADYITDKKVQLTLPLTVPVWATAGEAEMIPQLSEKVKENPYLRRASFNEGLRNLYKNFSSISPVSYEDNPQLYEICLFATETLTQQKPLVFVYDCGKLIHYLYNAFATDYQDKVFIHLSQQFFKESGMLTPEELCYLVGHELGHAQCHHSTLAMELQNDTSDQEYSADRAGLMVTTAWIRKHDPHCTMAAAARQAAVYGASSLHKLTVALRNGPGKTNWSEYDYAPARKHVDRIFDGASKLVASNRSHPHDQHRIMAMVLFGRSQLFYRCMGVEDLTPYPNLLDDEMLHDLMGYHLNREASTL